MATIKTRVTLLKELLALKEVIDTGQIQIAANKNGIKHSNMSKLISDLETRLNATLLQRTPAGSLPTSATPEIYSAIETICSTLDKIEQVTPEEELTGYISVMVAEGLVGSYILRELSRFYALYPKIRLDLLTNRQQNLSSIEVAMVDSNSNYQIPGRTLFRLCTPAYFFTTQEYLDTHGVPRDIDDMLENFDLCMYQSYLNIPECSFIAKRALLNGGIPYLERDGAYVNTDGSFSEDVVDEKRIAMVKEIASFEEKVAYAKMIRHTFVNGDENIQETVFDNGITVTIDLRNDSYQIVERNASK